MKRVIEVIGGISALIGFAGLAGAVELGQKVIMPLLILLVGISMMGATTIWEIFRDEKNVRDSYIRSGNIADRPSFLR